MRAETYAVVNLSALNLIESCAVAYNSFNEAQANRHLFRAEEMLKKIADALGYDVSKRPPNNVVTIGAKQEAAE